MWIVSSEMRKKVGKLIPFGTTVLFLWLICSFWAFISTSAFVLQLHKVCEESYAQTFSFSHLGLRLPWLSNLLGVWHYKVWMHIVFVKGKEDQTISLYLCVYIKQRAETCLPWFAEQKRKTTINSSCAQGFILAAIYWFFGWALGFLAKPHSICVQPLAYF